MNQIPVRRENPARFNHAIGGKISLRITELGFNLFSEKSAAFMTGINLKAADTSSERLG